MNEIHQPDTGCVKNQCFCFALCTSLSRVSCEFDLGIWLVLKFGLVVGQHLSIKQIYLNRIKEKQPAHIYQTIQAGKACIHLVINVFYQCILDMGVMAPLMTNFNLNNVASNDHMQQQFVIKNRLVNCSICFILIISFVPICRRSHTCV